jgi:hypothetical protein
MTVKDFTRDKLEESINHKNYLINYFSNGFFPTNEEAEYCPGINKKSTYNDMMYANKKIYKIFKHSYYHKFIDVYVKNR